MQCAATPSKGSLMTYAIRLPLLAVFLMAALLTGLALTAAVERKDSVRARSEGEAASGPVMPRVATARL